MNIKSIFNTITILVFLSSIPHLYFSFSIGGGKDLIFIICLLINTLILRNAIFVSQKQVRSKGQLIKEDEIFHVKLIIGFGVLYGIVFSLMPFLLPFHSNSVMLKSSLAIFLGMHNLLTGMCIIPMFLIFKHMWGYESHLEIQLWNRSNPAIDFYFRMVFSIVVHVALICSFAIASCLFSYFIVGIDFWVFSTFASLWLVIAYFLPHIPLKRQFYRLKRDKIAEINKLIQDEFDRQLVELNNNAENYNNKKLEHLQYLLKFTRQSSYYATLNKKVYNTTVSLIVVPYIPNLIKIMIEKMFLTA